MTWNKALLTKVSTGLRTAARNGQFVPGKWIDGFDGPGGRQVYGCGWGIIAWLVAVEEFGIEYAREMLDENSKIDHINEILLSAGLDESDLWMMTQKIAWSYFDAELTPYYDSEEVDWELFIEKSVDVAEYFIDILHRATTWGKITAALQQQLSLSWSTVGDEIADAQLIEENLPIAA